MNKLWLLGLICISTALHASCGDLDIKVINNSSHNCTFKNKMVYFGVLPLSSVPAIIPAHASSPVFSASQDNTGVGVMLIYTCDNEIVKFYSYQEYCGYLSGAGTVGGQPQDSTTLNLDYETKMGSSLAGRAGQIIWRIS